MINVKLTWDQLRLSCFPSDMGVITKWPNDAGGWETEVRKAALRGIVSSVWPDREDIVQEVFKEIYQSPPSAGLLTHAYVYQKARWISLRYLRKQGATHNPILLARFDAIAKNYPGTELTPYEQAVEDSERDLGLRAWRAFSTKYSQTRMYRVLVYRLQEKDHREIATLVGLKSHSTIGRELEKAMRLLRQTMYDILWQENAALREKDHA